jgi:ATP-dependent DNA helicase Q1
LELSREEHEENMAALVAQDRLMARSFHIPALAGNASSSSSSTMTKKHTNDTGAGSTHSAKQNLKSRITQYDTEIQKYEDEIRDIRASSEVCRAERQKLVLELEAMNGAGGKGKGKGKGIDYAEEDFEWTRALKGVMKRVWGIESFRLCQQG